MDIGELSLKERLALCQRVECLCVRRIRDLHRWVHPDEEAFRSLLLNLAEKEERHAAAAERLREEAPSPAVWHLNGQAMDRLIGDSFPAFATQFQTPAVDRAAAAGFLRALEEQSVRFYRELTEKAPDPGSRDFFRRITEEEAAHLATLPGNPA